MKRFSFHSGKQQTVKEYILYALGEVFLIVLGILLAMYINDLNTDYQYNRKVDENIKRVYHELENNLKTLGSKIETFQVKDSLIHLFMADSVVREDYTHSRGFTGLIINTNNFLLEEDAVQNLLQLNVSDNTYRDELISDLKSLYAMRDKIKANNDKMADFVYGILTKEIETYGKFAYSGVIDEKLLDYFLTSKTYKAKVIEYSVIAIRNQLKRYQTFYARGRGIYEEISRVYGFANHFAKYADPSLLKDYMGTYPTSSPADSLYIRIQNDSIFLDTPGFPNLHLIPYAKNRLFLNNNGRLGYFVSFFQEDSSAMHMRIHLLPNRNEYKKELK